MDFYRPIFLKRILDGTGIKWYRINDASLTTPYHDDVYIIGSFSILDGTAKLWGVARTVDEAGAEAFKKMYDAIASGNAMVVQDAKLKRTDGSNAWEMFTNNLRNNYVAGDMLVDLQKWRNMFCTEIGIPNANTEKKERMLSDEVNANNQETYTKADMWLEELKEGCEQAVKMFPGIELRVDWRFDNKGGENRDAKPFGTVQV